MSKINILDKRVYNKISAGEVVEKPASIVKELVENSIDAGAKNIIIEIENGGLGRISITDDGCGINSSDAANAFLPHATSKLKEIEDLETIATMGFRGEALSSIASVSYVEISTKTNEEEIGSYLCLEGGDVVTSEPIAMSNGTKITITNLFFNTPARLKFMRKPKTEEGDITVYMEKLILANPNINFNYIIDNKLKYYTNNNSLLDNIYTIYGKDTINNIIEVSFKRDDYSLFGYISKPEFSKANRTYQSLFVNNRFCNNALISTSVQNAFEAFLMKGKFPFYVLFLNLPQKDIDVNVHPSKLEIKFQDTKRIFSFVNSAIFDALNKSVHIKSISEENLPDENKKDDEIFDSQKEEISEAENSTQSEKDFDADLFDGEGISYKKDNLEKTKEYLIDKNKDKKNFVFDKDEIALSEVILTSDSYENKDEIINKEQIQFEQNYNLFGSDFKIVGKLYSTYLILQKEETFFIIDQHAAHERQLYDKIINVLEKGNNLVLQNLLVPFLINVNTEENTFMQNNLQAFWDYGFEIEEFGSLCYKLNSIPLLLNGINFKTFFNDLFSNLIQDLKKPISYIKEKLMQKACKASVKAGEDLNNMEINSLLQNFKENNNVLLCPHGRPVVIAFDKKQLEKWFKRIV